MNPGTVSTRGPRLRLLPLKNFTISFTFQRVLRSHLRLPPVHPAVHPAVHPLLHLLLLLQPLLLHPLLLFLLLLPEPQQYILASHTGCYTRTGAARANLGSCRYSTSPQRPRLCLLTRARWSLTCRSILPAHGQVLRGAAVLTHRARHGSAPLDLDQGQP